MVAPDHAFDGVHAAEVGVGRFEARV